MVRDFSMWTAEGAAIAQLLVQNSGAAPAITMAAVSTLGVATYDQWQGRVVVPAGGILSVTISELSSGPDVYVGGYLLRNTLT